MDEFPVEVFQPKDENTVLQPVGPADVAEVEKVSAWITSASSQLDVLGAAGDEFRQDANQLQGAGSRLCAHGMVDMFFMSVQSAKDGISGTQAIAELVAHLPAEAKEKSEVKRSAALGLQSQHNIIQRGPQGLRITEQALIAATISENPELKSDPDAAIMLDPNVDPTSRAEALERLALKYEEIRLVKKLSTRVREGLSKVGAFFKKNWDLCALAVWSAFGVGNLIAVGATGTGVMSAIIGGSVATAIALPIGVPALVLLLLGIVVIGGVAYRRRNKVPPAALLVPDVD